MSDKIKSQLKNYLRSFTSGGIALAYSGGADSSVLLAILAEMKTALNFNFRAIIIDSILQTNAEIGDALKRAENLGVEVHVEPFDQLAIKGFEKNPKDRCYMCKKELFARIFAFAKQNNLAAVVDGTNADDMQAYRPGLRVLKESGVISPFMELKITKTQVRALATLMNLDVAKKPPESCLATRFPYGDKITAKDLERVAAGEDILRAVLPANTTARLRVHGQIVRIEVPCHAVAHIIEHRKQIAESLKSLGYTYITLDLEGFRSGSLDI
ncbi:MAG: ATP-dependent sacrificial sulfur transferase LarE [Lentisphaerae bacterium]|jgi:uncharacterized protein|nr:ATP-dependent sacrificial sulfur transferase LarE [Lentisphaerota bacterium]